MIFDDIEFLISEHTITDLRPDSIAFDKDKNTFVIIEYKNVKNKSILDQGATYYRLLKEHMCDFVLLYNEIKKESFGMNNFNWDEAYVIFISPEFTRYQIGAAGIGLPIQLYQIEQYGDLIIIERVGEMATKHKQIKTAKNQLMDTHTSDDYDEEKYLNGDNSRGNASNESRELYFKLKDKILESFNRLEYRVKQAYVGFYFIGNNSRICTLEVRKSKVVIAYGTYSKDILTASDFVTNIQDVGSYGAGHYQSNIKDGSDIEKAIENVKLVYNYKSKKLL